jgi:hypothetical protein
MPGARERTREFGALRAVPRKALSSQAELTVELCTTQRLIADHESRA